jgi:hypothetical protein
LNWPTTIGLIILQGPIIFYFSIFWYKKFGEIFGNIRKISQIYPRELNPKSPNFFFPKKPTKSLV